ncbi:hypothetical protein GFJ94_10760 [Flavobacterium sp. LMO8]|uniref:hypothetical protein n=1 Tax=Flavobacterium sp. LMO8 TaxID=2654244 RepID=UPI001290E643|nr:hypothetical protein [Flavobacterium sp. LMO8]MQP25545.1 hypothetical protein [Flavobacterium sp. LMO8]
MKKIIFSLFLLIACNSISFAQDKKNLNPEVEAKLELNELLKVIPLEDSIENGLYSLLTLKHQTLLKSTTEHERNEVYATMKSKIEHTLNPEQLKKLKSNKVLYENLIK